MAFVVKSILMLFLVSLSSQTVIPINHSGNNFELLILHNNDMHARFEQTSRLSSTCTEADAQAHKCYGGFARVATKVKEARKDAREGKGPPVLYLNAGDTYTGTVWFTVYKWEIAAAFVNMLKPDAVSLGNHELDNGVSGLTPFIENLTCPVLCANIDVRNEPDLQKEKNLLKSIVLNVNGTKVGVIGYLTPDTKQLVAPNRVEYEDEVVAIRREVQQLQDEGIKILIALGHSGFETDKRIAKDVEGIDLVIGGHTNTFLWNGKVPDVEEAQGPYPAIVEQASKRRVPVVQAYAYTKYLGKLHMVFDSDGEMLSFDGEPLLLNNSTPQDEEVLRLLETFRPGVTALNKEVVGSTKVLLGGTSGIVSCRLEECNIGNLLTDAMIYKYSTEYRLDGWTDAPIALLQGGGIRSNIDTGNTGGNITRADLMAALPFDNSIVVVNITGKYLLEALEQSVYNYDPVETPGAFLQLSGLIVTYNLEKPAGSRVVSARARCGLCDVPLYTDIEDDDYYKIIMPGFLSNGGDGFKMFKDHMISTEDMAYNDVDTVVAYLHDKSPVYPEVGGRITLVKKTNGASSIFPNNFVMLMYGTMLSIVMQF